MTAEPGAAMTRSAIFTFFSVLLLITGLPGFLAGQSRSGQSPTFNELPGYGNYQKISAARRKLSAAGRASRIKWSADGKSVGYSVDGEKRQLSLIDGKVGEYSQTDHKPVEAQPTRRRRPVARARQRTVEPSPDGKWQAVYRENNLFIESVPGEDKQEEGKQEEVTVYQVTDGGQERLRYGTCCWVYGEELDQQDAMWWSPDGTKLVFYEVDEAGMKDYYLTEKNADVYTELHTVRYPKAGYDNPKVRLWVHDVATRKNSVLPIEGEPTQYLFNIRFVPDSHKLLVSRTNRHQNVLDILLVDLDSGDVTTVVTEKQLAWQKNRPVMQFLADGDRFVWETERNGYKHFELRNLAGERLNPLSEVADYPCASIVELDEEAGWFYYTAYSASNPYHLQLHRVGLDGRNHQRLTSSPLNHGSFQISPDHRWVVCVRESADTPPATVIYDDQGKEFALLAEGSQQAAEELGLSPPETFTFKADDGTEIYGTLYKPAHFDPSQRYPLLVDVYGGPSSRAVSSQYRPGNPVCELGYLVAKIGNRGTGSRGKAFETAGYQELGGVDILDQANGVRFLAERPYVDGERVGIYGHSYGGYMSALGILKYPDVFHVAVAGAPVTDWKQYDTIYTERYMRTPAENPDGYKNGSCLTYADQLQGKLLLVHGLIDDNVHPANTWELAKKLQDEKKRFDLMIYPGFKHGIGSTYNALRWEYFHRHLQPQVRPSDSADGS
ncbi:MAG: DPP IV N-terminal domain-containing protein [Mariniblastus sp.]|nr:DPP IV N-terminal domain-containing protein [Mariniblastus sp.]